jgi:glycosyltransferase involved in cell wall biosynthesis
MREACDRLIGWTMWEFDSLANMDAKNLSEIDYHFQTFDAILCYDEVTAEAMRPHCPDDLPLLVLQGGYDPEPWGAVERDWFSDRFGFAMCGVLSERKNPFAAIAAFKELKTEYPVEFEGAELHLKDTSGSLHPAIMETIPKLRIHYETWPMDVLKEFYRNQHVLLAPSHGEGKNLPALEFLSTGGTVIASNWGGHAQWLSDEYAYPVPVTLGQMPFHPDVHWANIDMEGLKAAMLSAYRNRDEAKKKGDIAARTIPAMCNWSTVVERLFTIANNLERREVTLIRGMP